MTQFTIYWFTGGDDCGKMAAIFDNQNPFNQNRSVVSCLPAAI